MTPDMLTRVLGDKWLRLGVLLLVLAALAHQLSLVIWNFMPVPGQITTPQSTREIRTSNAANTGANFHQQANAISRAFLFGKAETTAVVVEVEVAPETQLNYKLRGIYFSPEARLSSAIVEVQPNKSQHYLIDAELAENITLVKIEQDHILINRFGEIERLNLEKRLPPTARVISGQSAGGSANRSALLRSYKKRYTSNPMALATRFQAIPVQQDGKNIGFKLKALRGESLLKKLNFEPNDVFTAVNGIELQGFNAIDALKSLTTASDVTVTFMRNGVEQTQNFRL